MTEFDERPAVRRVCYDKGRLVLVTAEFNCTGAVMSRDEVLSWISAVEENTVSYRRMIDATISQLSDEELMARPAKGINSIAIILRHIGGNLRSRWTDFLTTDGEKPDRNRETEFAEWTEGRDALVAHLDRGWAALSAAVAELRSLAERDLLTDQKVVIRGEDHTVAQAVTRSITHVSYHVGQIAIVARMVHAGDWNWLTVAPGKSDEHNRTTWGTSASRSVFSGESAEPDVQGDQS